MLDDAGTIETGETATFNDLNDGTTALAAGALVVVEVADQAGGAAQAAVAGQDIYVLLDETYANLAAVETGLETGDHELTVNAGVSAEDSFFVVWSDGTDAHVSNVRIDTDTADFAAGDLVATDFAIITGTGTLTTGELHADNFVII